MTPPNRLQNLFDLAKLIRQTRGRGPLGHNQHGKSSEKPPSPREKQQLPRRDRPFLKMLFPRRLQDNQEDSEKTSRESPVSRGQTQEEQGELEHFFLENGLLFDP